MKKSNFFIPIIFLILCFTSNFVSAEEIKINKIEAKTIEFKIAGKSVENIADIEFIDDEPFIVWVGNVAGGGGGSVYAVERDGNLREIVKLKDGEQYKALPNGRGFAIIGFDPGKYSYESYEADVKFFNKEGKVISEASNIFRILFFSSKSENFISLKLGSVDMGFGAIRFHRKNGEIIKEISWDYASLWGKISENGENFIVIDYGSASDMLILFDMEGNKKWERSFTGKYLRNPIDNFAISPDGNFIIIGLDNLTSPGGETYLFDSGGNLISSYVGAHYSFMSNEESILCSKDGFKIIENATGQIIKTFENKNRSYITEDYSITGDLICISDIGKATGERLLLLFNRRTELIYEIPISCSAERYNRKIKISNTGDKLFVLCNNTLTTYILKGGEKE